jgi:ubiquinone/menaquinone biosynthesis C-methylase UbiE
MTTSNPFLDPAMRSQLYGSPERISRRTDALLAAKITGRNAADVIADLATAALHPRPVHLAIMDVGCGRGSTTRRLAERLRPDTLIAVDAARALLADARARLGTRHGLIWVGADFHQLPLPTARLDLAVAAFCLYHSAQPAVAVAELARCLRPGGALILVTKSADSYAELDDLVAAAGLDPAAASRPSLYETFSSQNLLDTLPADLHVEHLIHQTHRFRFQDLAHAARYLATSPKYQLPAEIRGSPDALTRTLAAAVPDRPVHATSTVSYAVTRRL